ncbi:SURF1 family protein [Altererythrobacter sp. KTW20L]|uniref:SURF1 family cytochrome oxidase biogenesis protein n=1 Tax=Altererythrobacter sp. KTW20L TaxID=2942210 RepID=UPI0020BF745D|nr:SURF1 family protein [Altererythrobacter sp. KTW20L]
MNWRKVPVIPTIVVAIVVLACIRFGFWQIDRAIERDASKVLMQERLALPPLTIGGAVPSEVESLYYRQLAATCAEVLGWEVSSGSSADQGAGWRYVASCLAPDGSSQFSVDMGVSKRPDLSPAWAGGQVEGRGRSLPDTRPISQRMLDEPEAQGLMIVAQTPAPGLSASKQPDPSDEENTSWSYAGQWFFFALTALVIYILALRRRGR